MAKYPSEFSGWLTNKLDNERLGVRDAARLIGVSHPTVIDILNGETPSFDVCTKIARAFGVMLRFAGCKVSDAEIKDEIDASMSRAVADGADKIDAEQMFALVAVEQLQSVLFRDAPAEGSGDAPGKTTAS
jgi:transcriptional regulator with XRE-family HTH domain